MPVGKAVWPLPALFLATVIALPFSAPRTPINVTPGAARRISVASYSLEDLRTVGKSQGATINDVVMTMCDMALRRYFDERGDDPEGPLVAYMPVNIRTDGDDGDGDDSDDDDDDDDDDGDDEDDDEDDDD